MNKYSPQNKILIMTQFFFPDYAATGQLIHELSIDLSRDGLDLEIFTGKPNYVSDKNKLSAPSREILGTMKIRRSNTINIVSKRIRAKALTSFLFFIRAIVHILRNAHRQDLIIITSAPPFLLWVGCIANFLFRRPYICIVYDLYPDILTTLKVLPENHWLIKLWRIANYYTWCMTSQIIVLDSSMKQKIIKICPEAKKKISIIHNWADENYIVPRLKQDNWFAKKYDLVDKFTVIYSGNMGRCHDMKTIIEAAQYLKFEPIKFLMIGNGAQYDFILEKIDELELNNFNLLPYQDKEVLPYSLTAGDLSLISVDKDMEGLVSPSKLYSALAAGLPVAVICPEQSFLCSLVTTAKCGRNFKNGDSKGLADFILLLSKNPELSKTMGESSRQYFLSNFKRNISTKKYYSIIKDALHHDRLEKVGYHDAALR